MYNLSPILRYLAFSVVLIYLVLFVAFYSVSHTQYNPILELEFADTPEQIAKIFVENGIYRTDLIRAIDLLNVIDFMYIAAYSIFLFAFFSDRYMKQNKSVFGRGTVFALIAFGADIAENMVLFKITGDFSLTNIEFQIPFLQAFTTLKWIALSLIFLEAFRYFQAQKYSLRYAGYVFFLPLFFAVISLITNKIAFELLWADSIMLSFTLLMVSVFLPHRTDLPKPQIQT